MATAKTKTKKAAPKKSASDSIVKMRDQGKTWAEIADKHDMTVGKAIFAYDCATVPADERLTGTDKQIASAVKKLRNSGMAWGKIAARAGKTEGWCRKVYFEAGGENVNVQRGGRYPKGQGRKIIRPDLFAKYGEIETLGKPTKKTAAKKAAPKKAAAKDKPSDMTPDQFIKAAKGKRVHTVDGDSFKLVSATNDNGTIEALDAEGEEWGFELSEVDRLTAR